MPIPTRALTFAGAPQRRAGIRYLRTHHMRSVVTAGGLFCSMTRSAHGARR